MAGNSHVISLPLPTQVAFEYLTGIGYAFHLFLDVTGHQRYSTFSNMAFGVGQTVGVVVPVLVMSGRQDAIVYVAISRTLIAVIHFIGNGIIATYFGWLDDFRAGILEIPFRVSNFGILMWSGFVISKRL